ncbi:hypothetical protein CFC21_089881 [Triticum aestivum]|uniref:DUF4005 domain-containing protein n=2 Tax=Triticum aestivum TaxID=4565 RepID=A0A9R1INS4_WHEAT|nr:hypothetical protein CFC21_089881 [Triticum aestivum]
MSTAAASRPSGPVLLSPFPNYQSASLSRVKLSVGGSFRCSLHKERKQEAPAAGSCSKHTASTCAQLVPSGSGSGCSKRSYNGLAQRVPMGSGHWARNALVPSHAVQQLQHRKRVVERFHAGASRLSVASMAGRINQ